MQKDFRGLLKKSNFECFIGLKFVANGKFWKDSV